MTAAATFKDELLANLPALRAFARGLCGQSARADDLVQEALLRAWANRDSFTLGTNMKAWLFTILRNAFYTDIKRTQREVPDPDGAHAATLSVRPTQGVRLELRDLKRALAKLPADQREALFLVSSSGHSYEEAARICSCAVGTIKSRVSRARRALASEVEVPAGGSERSDPGRAAEDDGSALVRRAGVA